MTRPLTSAPEDLRQDPGYHASPPAADATDAGVRELLAVREITQAFLTAERPEEVYQVALDRVSPIVGATFACVYLLDGASEVMRLVAVHNWPQRWAQFLGQMRVRVGFGPSGQAASERRAIEALDVFADEALADWQDVASELGFRSLVAMPLATTRAVLGAVTFYFASPNAVTPENRQLMRLAADQMAATAEKARLIDDLQRANDALQTSNAALEKQYDEAIQARRVKDEFLANISHELRTPLTAVMGYIALMQEGLAGPVTDEQRQTLDQVKDASEQLLGLIHDLLELTALKGGAVEIVADEIDPRAPLRAALAEARSRRTAVSLEVDEPDIVPMMYSDGRILTRALQQLVDNAYKFTSAGTVRATLEIEGARVFYRIGDTGIGISPEAHHLIFEEFRQVDGTMTRTHGGSGLGLALARRLARFLHGDVTVRSAPGEGSLFTLVVPLRYEAPISN